MVDKRGDMLGKRLRESGDYSATSILHIWYKMHIAVHAVELFSTATHWHVVPHVSASAVDFGPRLFGSALSNFNETP